MAGSDSRSTRDTACRIGSLTHPEPGRVRPDKVSEYLAPEFLSVSGLNNWAQLDEKGGIPKAMGEDGYKRFLAKIRLLVLASEYNIYRLERDLSYLPAASGSSAGN